MAWPKGKPRHPNAGRPRGLPNKRNDDARSLLASLGVNGLEGQARLALELQEIIADIEHPSAKLPYYQTLLGVYKELAKYQYTYEKALSEEERYQQGFVHSLIGLVLKHVADDGAREEIGAFIKASADRRGLVSLAGSRAS